MGNNVKKLVAFAIGISVMSGSIMPAFAADTIQNTSTITTVQAIGKPVLTLDDAIKAAISNSDALALDDKKISYQDKINDVNEKIDDATRVNDEQEEFNKDTRDNSLNQLKQQRDFDEDKLIQKTTKAYNNIVTNQMKIDKAARDLEIKNKQLNDTKLKKDLGIITSIDVQTTEIQIESLQNAQKSSENALKDAQYNFKILTGKDVTQYSLEQDIKYDKFKIDGSIDEYIDSAIDNYLKYKELLIKLNKDYYNDNNNYVSTSSAKFEISDLTNDKIESYKNEANTAFENKEKEKYPSDFSQYKDYSDKIQSYNNTINKYTGALAARLTYLNTKLGIYGNETSLNETKKQFKDQLRTLYTNLLTTEDNINTLKKNIELNNKQLSNAKLKYDLGMITKSEYDAQVVSSKDLELQLRSAIDSYNTLKEDIQKPWIAFS